MKILITGATGFLGRHAAKRFTELKAKVICLGRNKTIGQELEKDGMRFLPVDLLDKEAMLRELKGVDAVIHCAALSAPWGRYDDFYAANVLGTRHLVQAALKHHVERFIHVSTPSIYFDFQDRFHISESDPLPIKPCNDYAATKKLAEEEVRSFPRSIIIRPRGIFGPHDTTILPRLIHLNRQKKLPLIDGGKALVDMTYVDNVVEALVLCLKASENTFGKAYNISNGEPLQVLELYQLLFQELNEPLQTKALSYNTAYALAWLLEWFSFGKEPRFTRYSVGVLSKSQTLNLTAAKQDLGYNPHVTIAKGLRHFANWWRNDHAAC